MFVKECMWFKWKAASSRLATLSCTDDLWSCCSHKGCWRLLARRPTYESSATTQESALPTFDIRTTMWRFGRDETSCKVMKVARTKKQRRWRPSRCILPSTHVEIKLGWCFKIHPSHSVTERRASMLLECFKVLTHKPTRVCKDDPDIFAVMMVWIWL